MGVIVFCSVAAQGLIIHPRMVSVAYALKTKFKAFHFVEIGWFINFPLEGNAGKYADYKVVLVKDKPGELTPEKTLKLGEVLGCPEIDDHYPHTVGYYKVLWGDYPESKPAYLELREIRSVEEFWAFLNAANL